MDSAPETVAVIGCGAAGLAAAFLLSKAQRKVTLYESRDQLGGHANTVLVEGIPVDTGFLVFNENTYPNLLGLFSELNVPTEPSDMSFAVSLKDRTFEWSSNGLNALFGTRSNAVNPAFYSFLMDMARFNKDAPGFLDKVAADASLRSITMREYLDSNGYGAALRAWYLIPQVAAVWSSSAADVLAFPAHTFIQFCVNHSLVQIADRPQWRTVSRRSRDYVRRIVAALPAGSTDIKLSTAVTRVERVTLEAATGRTGVRVTDASGGVAEFDHVIFGAHPDDVSRMLVDATREEDAALRGFRYSPNAAYLHTDASFMPSNKACWSSWNYMGKGRSSGSLGVAVDGSDTEPCCVTYWLNHLQNLPASMPQLFVTLNPDPSHVPAPHTVLRTFDYSHPQFTNESVAAQTALAAVQGTHRVSFAGAYLGYGFHEDAITAGIRAAFKLTGLRPSWWSVPLYTTPRILASSAAALTVGAALSLEEVRIMKAAGGPYWLDNLGNGGAVGRATRAALTLLAPIRARAAARLVDTDSGSIPTSALRGSTLAGDMAGYTLEFPSDVVQVYRILRGCGREAAVTSSSRSPVSSGTDAAVLLSVKAGRKEKRSGGRTSAVPSAAASTATPSGTGDKASGGSARLRLDEMETASNSEGDRSSDDTEVDEKQSYVSDDSGASGFTGSDCGPSDMLRRAADSVVDVAGAARRGAYDALRSRQPSKPLCEQPLETGLQRQLTARRAFKNSDVATSMATQLQHIMADVSGSGSRMAAAPRKLGTSAPLGDRMAAGTGGYTSQDAPLHSPAAYPSAWSWVWDTAKTTALVALASPVLAFMRRSIQVGLVLLRLPDDTEHILGDPAAPLHLRCRIAVHSWNFFLRVGAEADLGFARSFMAGEWTGDDLTALFNIFVVNRDRASLSTYGLWTAWVGVTLNSISFAISLDNSLAGSRKNIHAHYDLSNDLFASFLDPETMMYSCGFFDTTRRFIAEQDGFALAGAAGSSAATTTATAASAPRMSLENADMASVTAMAALDSAAQHSRVELVFHGSLSDAQIRKLDHLIAAANVQRSDRVLDLGFGWGGMSIRLAETVGCRVHGITLSKEQLALATERVEARGLSHLVTFELVDYRTFATTHAGQFNKIISVEMIEAVGHNYFPSFMSALDNLLAPGGVAVIQAITIPESRYEEYIRTTDFINTIIFPGGCLPCIAVLTDAMKKRTKLVLDSVEDFGLHYAETLRRWRANFNAVLDDVVRPLGFDDEFIRTWNYYFCYCEAGFATQTLGLQILRFTRPNNSTLVTGVPSGARAVPIGPFTNDAAHPVYVPAGTAF